VVCVFPSVFFHQDIAPVLLPVERCFVIIIELKLAQPCVVGREMGEVGGERLVFGRTAGFWENGWFLSILEDFFGVLFLVRSFPFLFAIFGDARY
jgi:hypothetical protein